jgi:hypothetical protein
MQHFHVFLFISFFSISLFKNKTLKKKIERKVEGKEKQPDSDTGNAHKAYLSDP